ncbi:extracellular solute-binding protein [Bradyrhizobium sp. 2TAF24]|uniref:extracellular solute-binding protein n=1 Tax=Bradyrhizobium sp. 2TAF24 TaxID=3233011 RepID=UPI003F8FCCF0
MKCRLLALVAAGLMLSAPQASRAQQTEIVIYHYQSEKRYDALKTIFRRFEAENRDIRIVDIFKPDTTITADVQAALAARRPVDIAGIAGRNVLFMSQNTPAVALNQDAAQGLFLDNYQPQFLDVGRRGDKIFAMPYAFGTPIVYYNKDLFRKAGLDPDLKLRTWDDIIAAAKTIQHNTGVAGVAHLAAGNKDYGTMLMVTNAGGQYLNADGDRLLFDSTEGIAGLQLWQDLAVRHKVMPVASDSQWMAAFFGGRLAIYITSSAALRQAVQQTAGQFELGVASYPLFPGRTKRRVPNSGAAFMLYSPAGPRRTAALKFLEFMSRLEVANDWARESGYMPLLKDPLRDPAMQRYVDEFPAIMPVIAQMPDTVSTYVWADKGALEAQSIVAKLIDDLWAGRGTASELVPAAVRDGNAVLARGH